jgi:hypothetical protein
LELKKTSHSTKDLCSESRSHSQNDDFDPRIPRPRNRNLEVMKTFRFSVANASSKGNGAERSNGNIAPSSRTSNVERVPCARKTALAWTERQET